MRARDASPGTDLLDVLPALIEHLRAYDYKLGLEDELRLLCVRDEVRRRGGRAADVETLEQIVGPLVCRNADEQERLTAVLARWAAVRQPSLSIRDEEGAGDELEPGSRKRWWRRGLLLLWLALIIAFLWFVFSADLGGAQGGTAPAPAPAPASGGTVDLWALFWAVLSFLPLMAATFWILRRAQLAAIVRGMAPRDAQSESLHISVSQSPLFRPGAVKAALHDLFRHVAIPSRDLDARRTVAATARRAGFEEFIFARRLVLPDYLILIDRASAQDHFGDLGDVLAARLRAEQIAFDQAEYYGDPRRIQLRQGDGTLRSMELERYAAAHPDSRLLLFADPSSFWDPVAGRWREWVESLAAFAATSILTPLPPAQWGEREDGLVAKGFLVAQATSDGLASLAGQLRFADRPAAGGFESEEATSLDALLSTEPYRWTGDSAPPQAEIAELLALLRRVLGRGTFLHLAALAVFPAMRSRLTEQVGALITLADDSPAMTDQGYGAMSRLPWLRRGHMPDWLRKALLESLEPADSERVRAVWMSLLERDPGDTEAGVTVEFVRDPPSSGRIDNLVRSIVASGNEQLTERILVAFIRGERLPDLGIAAPSRVTSAPGPWFRTILRNVGSGPADALVLLGAAGLSLGLFFQGQALLRSASDWLVGIAISLTLVAALAYGASRVRGSRPAFAAAMPAGFARLFAAELVERFSYYGMRALLIFYLTQQMALSDNDANQLYGSFTTLVLIAPLVGGYFADRLGDHARAARFGAILLGGAYFLLAAGAASASAGMSLLALAAVAVGAGYLRGNLVVLVGRLYDRDWTSAYRDAGFTIFYVGINAGAAAGTLAIGYVGQSYGWTYGFGLAGAVIFLGPALLLAPVGQRASEPGSTALRPAGQSMFRLAVPAAAAVGLGFMVLQGQLTAGPILGLVGGMIGIYLSYQGLAVLDSSGRAALAGCMLIVAFHPLFWAIFEQSSMVVAMSGQEGTMLGVALPSWFSQMANVIFMLVLGPMLAALWIWLGRRDVHPLRVTTKFTLAFLLLGMGFFILDLSGGQDVRSIALDYVILFILLSSLAELLLAPTGMSAVTALAPANLVGLIVGTWLFSTSAANYGAQLLTERFGSESADSMATSGLSTFGWLAIGTGTTLFAAAYVIRRRPNVGIEA